VPPVTISDGASPTIADEVLAGALAQLRERHRDRPWLTGLTSLALAQALYVPEAALIRVLAGFVANGRLAYRGGYYCAPEFTPRLSAEQQEFFDCAFAAEAELTPAPLRFTDLLARIRSSPVPELRQAFEALIVSGAVAQVGEFVYLGSRLAAIRAQLESALRQQDGLTVAQFRTLTGTTRKYAVPLLEFFDAAGLTQRDGDRRVLRPSAPPEQR
jgi:selenocysteine-specific elongation factor